jgi:hypothetical protein
VPWPTKDGLVETGLPIPPLYLPLLIVDQGTSRGKHYFIGCTGWKPNSAIPHRSYSIPDDVDDGSLADLFKGGNLRSGESETRRCSRVVSSHIGARLKFCGNSHPEPLPFFVLIPC